MIFGIRHEERDSKPLDWRLSCLTSRILLALLIATVLAAWLARRLAMPLPVVLVMGGLAVALVPGIPTVQVPPELAFAIFVPPLFRAAVTTSTGEWRSNRRALLLLAIGLVGFTTVAVPVSLTGRESV